MLTVCNVKQCFPVVPLAITLTQDLKLVRLDHEHIIAITADCFGISPAELMSAVKVREIADARALGMVMCYKYGTNQTLLAIGKSFNRDHTTVIYSIDKVKALIGSCKDFKSKYEKLLTMVNKEVWQ